MLLNLNTDTEPQKNNILKFAAIISAGLLMVVIVGALRGVEGAQINFQSASKIGLVKDLGKLLFNEFLLPFEIVSILLLAAMVGAVMLGKTHMKRVQQLAKSKNGRPVDSSVVNIKVKELTNE
jgi:NADH-quinone oxidoreductase subunit J